MGVHTKRHEDGYGAGWAKEQWVSGSLLVGGMVGGQMRRHKGVPTDVQKDGRGILGQKNREVGQGKHKAQETFFYVIIFHAAHTPSSKPTGIGKH